MINRNAYCSYGISDLAGNVASSSATELQPVYKPPEKYIVNYTDRDFASDIWTNVNNGKFESRCLRSKDSSYPFIFITRDYSVSTGGAESNVICISETGRPLVKYALQTGNNSTGNSSYGTWKDDMFQTGEFKWLGQSFYYTATTGRKIGISGYASTADIPWDTSIDEPGGYETICIKALKRYFNVE